MGLGSCYSCIKYLMFAFNFLFWLLGCAILGVGIWVRVDPNFKQYVENSEAFNYLYACAYILIVIGVIVMIVGFLGCCGAIRESQCMLCTFFIFLFIIFAVLLSAGVWAIVAKETLKQSVTSTLQKAVEKYFTEKASQNLMDSLHSNLDCCGAANASKGFMPPHDRVAPTCKILHYGEFDCCGADLASINFEQTHHKIASTCKVVHYGTACDEKLFQYFSQNLIVIAGVAIGIGLVMLLGMAMSLALCCTIRKYSYNEGTSGYTRHTASSSWVNT